MTSRGGRKGRRGSAGRPATVSGGGDPAQLLPQALNAHHGGNLARARVLYEQVLAHHPEHADALQYLGILCQQEGDAARAEALIRRAVAARPDAGVYHDNLGTVLEGAGRIDEALAEYLRAEQLDGRDTERDYNLGIVLHRLARHAEAEARLRCALQAAPGDATILFALANCVRDGGNPADAEALYRRLLSLAPQDARVRLNLGNLLQAAGRLEEAEVSFREVLALQPGHAGAQHNLGSVLRRRGDLPGALRCFEAALERDAGLHAAQLGRAEIFELQGRMAQAMQVYRGVLAVPGVQAQARRAALRVLSVWTPPEADETLMQYMASALAAGEAQASALGRSGCTLLVKRYRLDAALSGPGLREAALALDQDALCLALLRGAVNVVPDMERWLASLRSAVLADSQLRRAVPALLGALAIQCRLNEFVMRPKAQDAAALAALVGAVDLALASGTAATAALGADLLGVACFQPLSTLSEAARRALPGLPGKDIARLLELDVDEPRTEWALAAEIETLAAIRDPVSSKVRAQYEHNPYPRWSELAPARQRALFGNALRERAPQQVARLEAGEGSILVAGCGSGQEALSIAAAMPRFHVIGLDLSLASLAYGRRMASLLGQANVRFVHGDLQHSARLGRRFQVITASGVLHHMHDPVAGWAALLEVLEEGGLMKVALYSRLARGAVRAAGERIAALGLQASADGVRELRRRILAGLEPELAELLDSEDFYSVSGCRDLLFHPVEQQYTLPALAGMLSRLGLEFLGFELPHALLQHRFLAEHPGALYSLEAWHEFEQSNPATFAAMYVFWCRRRP